MIPFGIAAGSVVGREHRLRQQNGHDAHAILTGTHQGPIIAVACDGCGSGAHSEVGAKLGCRLIAQSLQEQVASHALGLIEDPRMVFERVRLDVLAQLRVLARAMGGSFSGTISDYLLFTTVGAVLTERQSYFFGNADGIVYVNGQLVYRGEFADNAPPYLGYGLAQSTLQKLDSASLGFTVYDQRPTADVSTFLLATDGLGPAIDSPSLMVPGTNKEFGRPSQFWEDSKYVNNPDVIRRRLFLANRDMGTMHGIFPDDVTVIAGQRF